jgi:hypothetical protein
MLWWASMPTEEPVPDAGPRRRRGRALAALALAVLVGPRTVLTAAHCLMAPRSGRLVQPRSAHFMLGYHLGA